MAQGKESLKINIKWKYQKSERNPWESAKNIPR